MGLRDLFRKWNSSSEKKKLTTAEIFAQCRSAKPSRTPTSKANGEIVRGPREVRNPKSPSEIFETVVRDLLSAKLTADIPGANFAVFGSRKYLGSSGHHHQIDVSAVLTFADVEMIVLVECKHYIRKVEISDVLEFESRIRDVGAHKGLIVATVGFQEGAISFAQAHGIALVLVQGRTWIKLLACLEEMTEEQRRARDRRDARQMERRARRVSLLLDWFARAYHPSGEPAAKLGIPLTEYSEYMRMYDPFPCAIDKIDLNDGMDGGCYRLQSPDPDGYAILDASSLVSLFLIVHPLAPRKSSNIPDMPPNKAVNPSGGSGGF